MAEIAHHEADGILTVTLTRPEKKNALTSAMYGELSDLFDHAAMSATTKVLVMTGSADSFCAGNDLADFLSGPSDITGASPQARFIENLFSFEKPLIAAVNGIAVGIGVTMLLHCDLVYAAPSARFKTQFTSIGLVPEAGSTMLLPARVGALRAAELFLLDEIISAPDALEMGLITAIADDVVAHAHEKAAVLAAKSPDALRATKALLRRPQATVAEQILVESKEFSRLLASEAFKASASKILGSSK